MASPDHNELTPTLMTYPHPESSLYLLMTKHRHCALYRSFPTPTCTNPHTANSQTSSPSLAQPPPWFVFIGSRGLHGFVGNAFCCLCMPAQPWESAEWRLMLASQAAQNFCLSSCLGGNNDGMIFGSYRHGEIGVTGASPIRTGEWNGYIILYKFSLTWKENKKDILYD